MNPKILIVEDNAMNRELFVTVLETAGFDVLQCDNARQALALAIEERPELVLMDVGLAEIDGLAATRMMKSDPRTAHIPIVAVSAHAMKADETRALAAGCEAYLTKPIDTRALPVIVRRFVRPSAI
jgi:CheY-like chemotaxis protein